MSETTPLTGNEPKPDVEKGEDQPTHHRLNIMGRLHDAHKESSGPCDFVEKFFIIILDSIGFLIFAGILLAIPIAMIAVGAINLDDCVVQPLIPVWILVSGGVWAFQMLIYILKTSCNLEFIKNFKSERAIRFYETFNVILLLFNLGWFIAGNVFVFSKYPPNIVNPDASNFCEPGVYYFSFVIIIAVYAVLLFTACCSGVVAIVGIKDVARNVSNIATGGHGEPKPKE